jgi:hypothetical protein
MCESSYILRLHVEAVSASLQSFWIPPEWLGWGMPVWLRKSRVFFEYEKGHVHRPMTELRMLSCISCSLTANNIILYRYDNLQNFFNWFSCLFRCLPPLRSYTCNNKASTNISSKNSMSLIHATDISVLVKSHARHRLGYITGDHTLIFAFRLGFCLCLRSAPLDQVQSAINI